MKLAFEPHKIKRSSLKPLNDSVIVADMQFDVRTLSSGLILLNDNGTTQGIRPRWGKVYAVGPDQKDIRVGSWICVAHGRWTRGIDIEDEDGKQTLRRVDPKDVMMESDEQPDDSTMSDAIQSENRNRFAGLARSDA
jgi:co-chaperonin GroES (HSP10)